MKKNSLTVAFLMVFLLIAVAYFFTFSNCIQSISTLENTSTNYMSNDQKELLASLKSVSVVSLIGMILCILTLLLGVYKTFVNGADVNTRRFFAVSMFFYSVFTIIVNFISIDVLKKTAEMSGSSDEFKAPASMIICIILLFLIAIICMASLTNRGNGAFGINAVIMAYFLYVVVSIVSLSQTQSTAKNDFYKASIIIELISYGIAIALMLIQSLSLYQESKNEEESIEEKLDKVVKGTKEPSEEDNYSLEESIKKLEKLKALKETGTITEEEYGVLKVKVLNNIK